MVFPDQVARPMAMPRRSIPSISGLIAFEATARHRSFSQAARDLDLSQGAVSKRVRQLEEVLGVALFARDRHHVELTTAGRTYLSGVSRILTQLETASEAIGPQPACDARLSVAVSPGLAAHWLIPRLACFHARHPGTTVNLVTRTGPADPAREGCDAAIMAMPAGDARSGMALFKELLLPMASPALIERLRRAGLRLDSPSDLAATPRLHLAGRPDLWSGWFARAGLNRIALDEGPRHDSLGLLVAAAVAGHGVALLPRHMTDHAVAEGRLHALSELELWSGREIVLAMNRAGRDTRAANAFRRWLVDASQRDAEIADAGTPQDFSEAHSIK